MPAQVHDVDSPPHQPPPRVPNINPRPTQRLKQEQEPSPDSPAKSPTADRESRPPAKRSRKAINCDPCRTSKLKCDRFAFPSFLSPYPHLSQFYSRAKPCSSCVLRGKCSSPIAFSPCLLISILQVLHSNATRALQMNLRMTIGLLMTLSTTPSY